MLIATITEAKNKLSALIDRVRAGESVLIVDRGRPVARLEPALSASEDNGGRLSRLERAGLIRIGATKAPSTIAKDKPPRARQGVSIVDTLLNERRGSR